jgi:hypothetical protein
LIEGVLVGEVVVDLLEQAGQAVAGPWARGRSMNWRYRLAAGRHLGWDHRSLR